MSETTCLLKDRILQNTSERNLSQSSASIMLMPQQQLSTSTSPPILMDNINRITKRNQTLDSIKPSMCGQILAIYKHFFLLKRRLYCRLISELFFPALLISLGFYLLMVQSPSVKQLIDQFKDSSWSILPSVMMFTLWIHFYYSLVWIVTEKHEGFLLLMHTMGLKKLSYYIGLSLGILTISLPISLTIGYLFKVLFPDIVDSSYNIFPLLFILYSIQHTSVIFAVGSLINSLHLISFAAFVPFLGSLNQYLFELMCDSIPTNFHFIPMIVAYIVPQTAMSQMLQAAYIKPKPPTCQNYQYPSQNVSILLMISWSILMYSFAWYFDSICPWQTTRSPKAFLYCLKSKAQRLWNPDRMTNSEVIDPFVNYNRRYFEKAPQNKPLGIYINDVSKRFSNSGSVVNSLSFSIYRGQTTLLLGHNGAGKTTLMNMIIGNLEPTQGKLFINGYDIDTCPEEAKIGVGLCPQQSLYMEEMTVDEHLYLFASIKCNYFGLIKEQHIQTVLKSVGLIEHRHKIAKELSGGMKRKLSLGLAFVGDSNVLILDEPSSGVDPESRKFIWDSIRMYRTSRTVLLSTQHMEEADYLGDRIAIMNDGKIVCCGSSVFLKKAFGTAYRLRIECSKESLNSALLKVCNHFPKAKIDQNDQAFANHNLQYVDTNIELIPNTDSPDDQLIQLFEDLEKNYKSLGIKSFGLKCSSIEDVLLNSAKAFDGHALESNENITLELNTTSNQVSLIGCQQNKFISSSRIYSAYLTKHLLDAYHNLWSTMLWRLILPIIIFSELAFTLSQMARCSFMTFNPSYNLFLLSVVITGFIKNPLIERTSKFKLMQLCSKATHLHYWISRMVADMLYVILFSIIFIISSCYLLTSDQMKYFGGSSEFIIFSFLIITATLITSLVLVYLLSTCIDELSNGMALFMLLMNIHKVFGAIVIIVKLVLIRQKQTISAVDEYDKYFYYFLPTVTAEKTFQNGFLFNTFQTNCLQKDIRHLYSWSSEVWLGMIVLLLQAVVYTIILLFVETKRVNILRFFSIQYYFINKRPSGMDLLDEDVTIEEIRTRGIIESYSGIADNALIAKELTKSYTSKERAVDGLTLTVAKSECFGLLGPNGAGKSTTFSMLTGEVFADYGQIVCNKLSPESDLEAYCESIGYDPQTNPELSLTPVETLYFMARLRSIEENRIKPIVEAFLDLFNMHEHRDKSVARLSGGTKRKLSLAMAIIGSPRVLMLDEPTAGIDPMARRDIWLLLSSLKSRFSSSIIISSHAMEECEAICDRLTIMIQGRMRCLGSFQHLRSKFGQGFIIRIQFDANADMTEENNELQIKSISEYLTKNLQNSVIMDDISPNSVVFKVTNGSLPRSMIFKILKTIKIQQPSISFLVSDSTLEDIFVSLAKEQKEPKKRHL